MTPDVDKRQRLLPALLLPILLATLPIVAGCSDRRLSESDHDAIGRLVKQATGKTEYRLVQNAPCTRPCSQFRRLAARRAKPLATSEGTCGLLAVVGEGNTETILQMERTWRGWSICVRATGGDGSTPGLDQPFPLGDRP